MRLRLSREAADDLNGLLHWGAEHFGVDAALDYYDGLLRVLDLLASSPRIGHEIRDDVRAHPHRSHIIVYREDGGKLEVLMVRHGRSNWRKYL